MMKKLWIVMLMLAFMFVGCLHTPGMEEPVANKLEISVASPDKVNLEVCEGRDRDSLEILHSDEGLLKLSHMSNVTDNKLNHYIFSGISTSDYVRLIKDTLLVEDLTDIRHMRLFLNSGGGNAFTGLAIADKIISMRKDGWTVEVHGSGIVASAAVPIFAVCRPRAASPGTMFMVHEAALFKWPGRETASDIAAQNELMLMLRSRYLKFLVDNSNVSPEEWRIKERMTTWFTTDQAREWGMID